MKTFIAIVLLLLVAFASYHCQLFGHGLGFRGLGGGIGHRALFGLGNHGYRGLGHFGRLGGHGFGGHGFGGHGFGGHGFGGHGFGNGFGYGRGFYG